MRTFAGMCLRHDSMKELMDEVLKASSQSVAWRIVEKMIHHDLDSVYTSYRWLEAILLDDDMRVSYSENGAKGYP